MCLCAAVLSLSARAAEPVSIDWQKARGHWSFVPPQAQPLPSVKNATWPRGRLDYFILGKLERERLTPSHEADRRTLIRRLSFDLAGLPVYDRGDVESPGATVPRGYLRVLSKDEPARFHEGSGRAELADLIANAANPLTARVMVNRIWDQLFGKPLVRTTSNFGATGDKPTHPELLDDLAVRFAQNGWSVKRLMRELVLSATYRQSSGGSSANARLDEANTSLWRMERRRLGVEQFRDAVLAVSGVLSSEGGPSLDIDAAEHRKRTVYSKVSRRELNKTLMLFDYPDANVHAARRSVSTTPMQKLFVMNSPFIIGQAGALARRLQQSAGDDAARIRLAYELLFARAPQADELSLAHKFLQQAAGDSGMTGWEQFAQALLATNEMLYVD